MKLKNKISDIYKLKKNKNPFTCITAYDFPSALIINELDIPLVLVGDSASMVVYGYENTTPISMDELLLVTKAVSRGIKTSLIIGDMPFMSYQPSIEKAIYNAGRLIKEGRVDAIKLEGGAEYIGQIINIIRSGIPVMGHIGLMPQSVLKESGYKIQGKTAEKAINIYKDAIALEKAGVFAIVLEGVPEELAAIITNTVKVPTIGIGAGISCDGQIQVLHDVIGLFNTKVPKHSKVFVNSHKDVKSALSEYKTDVENKKFPKENNSIRMNSIELIKLKKLIENI
ncbi:3-methyl-2-oxobutanoate hydroxymethyltransferase [Candidatus Marinimicrobia bacterium]|nr:3-methyl-2-oxobutanoate hydroxymethyltransferase [Candidatus Neomarinimicrobiota bacterium]